MPRVRKVKKATKTGRGQQGRGRPASRRLPPRINATPEQILQALLSLPRDHEWQYLKEGGTEYRCSSCSREVNYPEVLYDDGRCEGCHGQE